jgi:hypothetical protein
MSYLFAALNTEFQSKKLKAIAVAMASRADGDGMLRPSYKTIAKDTGYSRQAVVPGVAQLCSMGLFRRESGGPTRSNRYTFREAVKDGDGGKWHFIGWNHKAPGYAWKYAYTGPPFHWLGNPGSQPIGLVNQVDQGSQPIGLGWSTGLTRVVNLLDCNVPIECPRECPIEHPTAALAGGVVESIDTPEEETVDAIGRIPVSPTAAEPPPQAPSAPPRWEMAAWAILDGRPVPDKATPEAEQYARDRLNEARDLGVGRGRLALARKPPSSPLMEALRKDDPALYRAVHWAWNPRVEEGNGWYKEQGPLSKALARNLRQSLLDHCPESYGPGAVPWWRPPGYPPLADGSPGNTPGVDCCPVCKANGGKDVQDSGTFRHIDCACRRGYAWALGAGGKAQASAPPKAQAPSARPAGPGKYNPQAGLVMKEAV